MIPVGIVMGLLAAVFGIRGRLGIPVGTRARAVGLRHGAGNFVVLVVFAVGWWLRQTGPGHLPGLMAAGFIGFLGNEAVALYRIRVGRSIGSAALVADGYHARTDGLTSLAVVVGALGVAAGYTLADPLVGLLITVVILFVLKQAASQVLGRLMDAVEPELVEQVETVAASVPQVQSVDRLRVRWLGHVLEASMAITVDCDMTVTQGHRVSEEVRHRLLHKVRRLDTVVIHVNPCGHDGEDPHAVTRHHDSVSAHPSAEAGQ